MDKEKILGFDVCTYNEENFLKEIFNNYDNNKQSIVLSINPEIVINNYKDKDFLENINKQEFQIPDGIGIVFASKINGGNITKRITGIDFMNNICTEAIKRQSKIFLYGAKPGIAEKAKQELENNFKNIKIVGCCNGYVEENVALEKIENANPDIVFVAIGSPKQEKFIINNKEKLNNVKIFMPVGGSFDVISNTLKRAPNLMIKSNLEWLYRLVKQPVRFFRQIKLIKFVFCVIINKIFKK